jgi:Transposase
VRGQDAKLAGQPRLGAGGQLLAERPDPLVQPSGQLAHHRGRVFRYAEGARNGALAAIQVADRWHLWHNLAEYAEKAVVAHRGCLKDPAGEPGDSTGPAGPAPPPTEPDGLRDVCGRERRLITRTRERHAAVHQLLAAGHSPGSVSRTLGLDRTTAQRFAREPDADTLLVKATSRDSKLDPFKAWIHQRWNQGITDASVLHAELQAHGWTGSVQAVRRYVRPFRAMTAAPPPPPAVPKARQITSWLLHRPETLSDDGHAQLTAIRARCPHIDALAGHVTSFAEMMTRRTGENDLETWLAAVEAGDLPELRSFAAGIRTDQQAVTNSLTFPLSSGKVEGTVNNATCTAAPASTCSANASSCTPRNRITKFAAEPGNRAAQLIGIRGLAEERPIIIAL